MWIDPGDDDVHHDIMGLRATVYGTCALVVLLCLVVVVLALL